MSDKNLIFHKVLMPEPDPDVGRVLGITVIAAQPEQQNAAATLDTQLDRKR